MAASRPDAPRPPRRVRMARGAAGPRGRAPPSRLQRSRARAASMDLTGGVEFDGDRLAEVGSRISRAHRPGARAARARSCARGRLLAEIESAAVGEAAAQLPTRPARRRTASRAWSSRASRGSRRSSLVTARELEQARAACATNDAQVQSATHAAAAGAWASRPATCAASTECPRAAPRRASRAPSRGKVVERSRRARTGGRAHHRPVPRRGPHAPLGAAPGLRARPRAKVRRGRRGGP
jgi:hypothetical protein